jgi:hypothetical protein
MNRERLLTLIVGATLLIISISGCSRKEAANKDQDNSNQQSSQAAAPQPAAPQPTAPQPEIAPPQPAPETPTPPVSEPAPRVAKAPEQKRHQTVPASETSPQQQAVVTPTPVPAAAPLPTPKPIVIPAGTILKVRLDQPISSEKNKTGDQFQASVISPIMIQGETIVPTGSRASGTVTDAKDAGRFKGAASLTLALNSVGIGGKAYKVQTEPATQTSKGKGSRTAKIVGGGTAGGALIGGLAGGGKGATIGALVGAGAGAAGAATGNADINLPVETVVQFQTTAPLTLPPRPATKGTDSPEVPQSRSERPPEVPQSTSERPQ